MLVERSERLQYGVDARPDVSLAAAQRGEPERDQRILETSQVMPA